MESYKTILTNERFKVNEPYELLIHSTDINASIINDLYDTIQKNTIVILYHLTIVNNIYQYLILV